MKCYLYKYIKEIIRKVVASNNRNKNLKARNS